MSPKGPPSTGSPIRNAQWMSDIAPVSVQKCFLELMCDILPGDSLFGIKRCYIRALRGETTPQICLGSKFYRLPPKHNLHFRVTDAGSLHASSVDPGLAPVGRDLGPLIEFIVGLRKLCSPRRRKITLTNSSQDHGKDYIQRSCWRKNILLSYLGKCCVNY